jgi:hypothetical protein
MLGGLNREEATRMAALRIIFIQFEDSMLKLE